MNIFSNLSAHIKLMSWCQHDADWYEQKTKVDYTLWSIYEGHFYIEINGNKFRVQEGDIVLFYPGDTYKAYSDNCKCRFIFIFFSLETGNNIDLLENKNLAGVYSHNEIKLICRNFCKKYINSSKKQIIPDLKLYACFLDYIANLNSLIKYQKKFYEIKNSIPSPLIYEILEYIDEHIGQSLQIKDLALLANMKEKYFVNFFYSHIGISPKKYLVERRMKYSIKLLSERKNSLSNIAAKLGYSDQYAFSKAFKKYFGEAPSKFRKHLF